MVVIYSTRNGLGLKLGPKHIAPPPLLTIKQHPKNMLAKQVDQHTQTAAQVIDQKRIALQQNSQVLVESHAVSVLSETASEQV